MPLPSLFQIIPKPAEDWSSDGVSPKPKACRSCRQYTTGTGFCADDNPEGAKIAVLMPMPMGDTVIEQRPLSDGVGHYFLRHFVYQLGHKRNEVLGSHCIRCMPKFQYRNGRRVTPYPAAVNRAQIENTCRLHDDSHGFEGKVLPAGLLTFNPNIFIITYDIADLFRVGAYHRQMLRDMEKAWQFAAEGFRPCVLAGLEPMELVAPWLADKGGVKVWRSHFFEGSWPFKLNQGGFQ